MSEPIVFISHFRIKEGRVDDVRRRFGQGARALEAQKPQTLVFVSYVDPAARAVTIIHAFGDAAAMDLHVEGAEERAQAAYELLEPDGWEIYGRPSEQVLESMRRSADSFGVTLRVQLEYVAGFLRTAPRT
jgi:hypothetical protein